MSWKKITSTFSIFLQIVFVCVAHLKKNFLIDIEKKNDLYGLYQIFLCKHLIKSNERLMIITKIEDLLGQIISSLYCHTYAQCVSRPKTSIHILKFKMQTHSLVAL